jgi:EAL domain-containing protein (putative c-di-GMP-specific phosphodiesterase class I)
MSDCAIVPHFQPIVSLADESVVGYELLARSRLEGLESPAAMFAAAEKLDQEVPLSVLMRRAGILAARHMPGQPRIFVNTHAKEAVTPELLASLSEIRQLAPRQPIVVEFHEAAITDERMHGLRERLDLLNMQLAFDDFGAGQARLDDLTRFRPDFVKFDIKLIRRIHLAEPERVRMLQALVEMVRDLGAVPLAEGVEEAQEAQACRALGFTLAQGYYFGRPGPLDASGNVVSARGGG